MAASEGASSVTLESGIEEAFKAWGLSHHIPKLLEEGFKTVSELLVVSPEDLKTELGFDKLADRSKLRHHLESLSSPPSSSSSPSSSPSSSSSTSEASAPPAASAPPVDYFARSTVRELISALQGKRVSLLVGSGWSLASTSKPGQPPPSTLSWPGLLRNGIEYVCQLKTAAAAAEFREEMQKLLEQWELVTAASKICHFLLNEVENPQHFKFWLQGAFEAVVPINQTLGAVIRHLVDDFDIAVTTTNYDNVLEDQLGRVPLHRSDHLDYWTEWLQNLNDARKKVVHWHGHYRRPEDVVLDETQYQNMIKDPRNKNFQIAMGVAATTTTLLFLGCGQAGLSDPNWGRLLKRLNSLAISRTFALCTVGELPAFSGVPGVIAIPYGEKHTDLDAFLVRLYNAAKGIDSTELSAASSTSRSIAAVPPPSSSSSSSSSASTSSSPSSSSSGAAAPKPFPESSSRPFFAVDNSTLYKVSPENGQWQAMPGSWPEVKGGTYSPATSSLYVFHKTTLYRVSTEDGKWQAFSGSWTQPQAAASCGDHLYVLDTGILYRVSPLDGSWEPLDTTWIEGKGLAAVGDSLYSVAAGILYRIASADASHTAFAGNWTNLSFLTAAAGALFAVDGTTLYRVSPEDGTWKALPGSWSQVKALAGTADHLFIVNNTTLYRVSPQDGTWQAFPGAWKATSWLF